MLKNSGVHVLKWRLNRVNLAGLCTELFCPIYKLSINDILTANLINTYKQFVHSFFALIYIRQGGYLSPLYTAPYNNNY